jgi:hypothetical protein
MNLRDSRLLKPLLVLSSSIFCVALADIGMGILFRDHLVLHRDERNLTYRYDPELGWFPISNSKKTFTGSRTIHVEHNSRGFRDTDHVVDTKPRIIFLGDSFVWGYDVEQKERFTDKLRDQLAGWSVYNLGVSGYGTDQEYLLLKRQYDFYRPQIVFLVFCRDNDDEDNSRNVRYGVYYKPYFTVDGAGLSLRGVPVPKSENYFFSQHYVLAKSNWVRLFTRAYFILNAPADFVALRSPTQAIITDMQRFIDSKGGRLIIGLQSSYPELETFLKDRDIPYVDLSNSYSYTTQSRHWTPEGHAFVSDKIKEFLVKGHYLQSALNKMSQSDLETATRETRR